MNNCNFTVLSATNTMYLDINVCDHGCCVTKTAHIIDVTNTEREKERARELSIHDK